MSMTMVKVGNVRMIVGECRVPMLVTVWLTDRSPVRMRVLVMFVMHVLMLVLDRLVDVNVAMAFAQHEVHAEPHDPHRCDVIPADWFS
jgi:hypothetical protein